MSSLAWMAAKRLYSVSAEVATYPTAEGTESDEHCANKATGRSRHVCMMY